MKNMESKQEIRKKLKFQRDSLTEREIMWRSAKICDNIKRQFWFEKSEVIYFYYPLGSEVNLLPLAKEALLMQKQIAFPRVEGRKMDFFHVTSLHEFEEGCFHVMEPIGTEIMQNPWAVVLTPGLGFDFNGNRMGYGKGYYDRYFAEYPECRKIGVAYDIQIVESIICDEYDIPMDAVVTETGFISAGNASTGRLGG